MLYLKCEGQVMRVEVDERIADKYINANTVHFEFCERWDGMVITAQFTQNGHTYNKVVDAVTNTVILPNEIVAGTVEISAFGEHPTTGVRITSIAVKKTVDKSGFVGDGEMPIPPTPDLYAQLLDKVNKTAIPHVGANGNWWFDDYDSGVSVTEEAEAAKNALVNEINRVGMSQLTAIDSKAENALESIPEDYATLDASVKRLKDVKADAIMDESARAASHVVYPQDGSRLAVTLYGKTTETGSGDKSPDNPYVISGVDVARVQAGGKNLFDPGVSVSDYFSEKGVKPYAVNEDGTLTLTIQAGGQSFFFRDVMLPIAPPVTFSTHVKANVAADARFIVRILDKDKNILTTGCSGTYNTYYLGFWQKNSTTGAFDGNFTITNKNAAYVVFGIGFSSNSSVADWTTLTASEMFAAYGADVPYEPYNANVINLPLIPDGAPLMEGDTVENDVLSGCDKCVTVAGTHSASHLTVLTNTVRAGYRYVATDAAVSSTSSSQAAVFYSDKFTPNANWSADNEHFYIAADGQVFIWIEKSKLESVDQAGVNAYFAANPLTVFYRSTEYTPEKDLNVCKVVRKWKTLTLDGSEAWSKLDMSHPTPGCITFQCNNIIKSTPFAADAPATCDKFVWNAAGGSTVGPAESWWYNSAGTGIRFITSKATTAGEWNTWLSENPVTIFYPLATPEVYMTDPLALRKPTGIMPVTVTGSSETEVSYPHDTKHYIDSQIAAAVALALNG